MNKLDDRDTENIFSDTDCMTCERLFSRFPPKCKAFPDGIPKEIQSGELQHHHAVEGDHGLQYKHY